MVKLFRLLFLLPLLLSFICCAAPSLAFNCPESERYDTFRDVDGEALYAFTSDVIAAVRDRDMKKLVSFFDGELRYGPRRSYLLKHEFSEIFSEDFRQIIIDEGPKCSWFNDQGVMLGWGQIWIDKKAPDSFYISSITWWEEEPRDPDLPTGWQVDGRYLRPDCFPRDWPGSDNYEGFRENFKIPLEGQQMAIGKHLAVLPYSIPRPSCNDDPDGCEPVVVVAKVGECCERLPEPLPEAQAQGYGAYRDGMAIFDMEDPLRGRELYYFLLQKKIPADRCQALAPGFKGQCVESYLVNLMENFGGTMSFTTFGIYGLFIDPEGQKLIAPLRYFPTEAEGLDFVDELLAQ